MSSSGDQTFGLEALGFHPLQVGILDSLNTTMQGLSVVCGPVGSGKSVTLQAILANFCHGVREPVAVAIVGKLGTSYQVPNARLVSVFQPSMGGKADVTKLLSLKSQVVVFDGYESLCDFGIIEKVVASGRKVLLAMNAPSAVFALELMVQEGFSRDLLATPGCLVSIVCQRSLGVLCPKCSLPVNSEEVNIPQPLMKRLQHVVDFSVDDVRTRGAGCDECANTGYVGRTMVAEILVPDARMLRMLASASNSVDCYEYWKNSNLLNIEGQGVTLLAHAITKIRSGILDPLDVERHVNLLTYDMVMADLTLVPTELGMLTGSEKIQRSYAP
jgi:type II secretory ATPase GspE/PulE/Tfp pilus assembly ATPase PilB-like protein